MAVTGALALPSSGAVSVNLTDNANAAGEGYAGLGTYELISYSGALTGSLRPLWR